MGEKTALVTHRFATPSGAMSCNTASGGLGKVIWYREVDALDAMWAESPMCGISVKGCSIAARVRKWRGPRAQADRKLYDAAMPSRHPRDRETSHGSKRADEADRHEKGHVTGNSPGR